MTVLVPAQVREAMVANAYACHPEESCGLLAGPEDGSIRMAYPLTNVLHSHTNYTIDPTEHFRSLKHADRQGWDLIGVFHSHPHTQAYPSVTDVRLAVEPDWLYVLVGMERFDDPAIRGFRIRDGEVTEETLTFEPGPSTLAPYPIPTETLPPPPNRRSL
jgi:proteasome lid subunit RPN8/RPN11